MKNTALKKLTCGAFETLPEIAGTAVRAIASHIDQFKVVDGLSVHLGVLPAEIVGGHSPEHPELVQYRHHH